MTQSSLEASPPTPGGEARAAFASRCNAIEEAYEFMLAYAAQGLPHEATSGSSSQIRDFLRKCEAGVSGLSDVLAECVRQSGADPAEPYEAFIEVIDRDATAAGAALRLVLAQPSIGSQLVDNLNASSHLRALLTDLFLLDEVLKSH